jgi:hypothetical protein
MSAAIRDTLNELAKLPQTEEVRTALRLLISQDTLYDVKKNPKWYGAVACTMLKWVFRLNDDWSAQVKLDGKFGGTIFRMCDAERIPEDCWMIFTAYDDAVPATLEFYRDECARLGCDPEQLAAVERLMQRVTDYRLANPTKSRNPTVRPGETK